MLTHGSFVLTHGSSMHALLICVRSLCAAVPGCVPGCVPGSGSWLLGGGAKVARHAELPEKLSLPMRQHQPVFGRRASRSFFKCRVLSAAKRTIRVPRTQHSSPSDAEEHCEAYFALRLKAPKQIGNEAKGKAAKRKRAQVTAKPDACNTAAEPCYVYCAWSLRRVKPPASRSAKPAHGQLP